MRNTHLNTAWVLVAVVLAAAFFAQGGLAPTRAREQQAPAGEVCGTGDVNGDGVADAGDISCEILVIFSETPPPECAASCTTLSDRVTNLETILEGVSRVGDDLIITGTNLHVGGPGLGDEGLHVITQGEPYLADGVADGALYNPSSMTVITTDRTQVEPPMIDSATTFHVSADAVEITGANLYVTNGTGTTDGTRNGLGNVIIGYNEERTDDGIPITDDTNDRTGSHMLVVGSGLNYSRSGGIVAGYRNTVSGNYASVSAGYNNTAGAAWSSVSGGGNNKATGSYSSVGGGDNGVAFGPYSTITGGRYNAARGECSSVSGGSGNTAGDTFGDPPDTTLGKYSAICGGRWNRVFGDWGSVSGGLQNTSSAYYGAVLGGQGNFAGSNTGTPPDRTIGQYSSIGGGQANTVTGHYSSISGGRNNSVTGSYSSICGGDGSTAGASRWMVGPLVTEPGLVSVPALKLTGP